MEIGTQHKYAFDILVDFKPEESPMRPAAAEIFASAQPTATPRTSAWASRVFPLADLLSEPIKIVQAPRLTMVLYEVDNLHRQIFTDGRTLPKEFDLSGLPGLLGRALGGRHLRRGNRRLQRQDLAGCAWGTRIATRCASRSASAAATSGTWM